MQCLSRFKEIVQQNKVESDKNIFTIKKQLFKLKFCYLVKLFFFYSKNVAYDYKRVFVSNVYGLRLSFGLCAMSIDDKAREPKQWKLQESITQIRALTRNRFLRSAQNNAYAPTK